MTVLFAPNFAMWAEFKGRDLWLQLEDPLPNGLNHMAGKSVLAVDWRSPQCSWKWACPFGCLDFFSLWQWAPRSRRWKPKVLLKCRTETGTRSLLYTLLVRTAMCLAQSQRMNKQISPVQGRCDKEFATIFNPLQRPQTDRIVSKTGLSQSRCLAVVFIVLSFSY